MGNLFKFYDSHDFTLGGYLMESKLSKWEYTKWLAYERIFLVEESYLISLVF
jgi:hypothetical protein